MNRFREYLSKDEGRLGIYSNPRWYAEMRFGNDADKKMFGRSIDALNCEENALRLMNKYKLRNKE